MLGPILLSVVGVSLVSLAGILTVGLKIDVRKTTFYVISLVSGTMLGGAFLHLIPEALEAGAENVFLLMAAGVFLFFLLEKLLIWRHCHHPHSPHEHKRPIAAKLVITGDAIHNFIDGVIIASAFLTSPQVGISITIAILLHEIPQEIGDYGLLIHSGYSPRQALLANLATASSAVLGALLTYFLLDSPVLVQKTVLPIAAGGFLYIALADLIPQLHEEVSPVKTFQQIALLLLGFGLMMLLHHNHH